MNDLDKITDNTPHTISEVVCLKCLSRWVAVRPHYVLLKNLECQCGHIGFVINTGQELMINGQ